MNTRILRMCERHPFSPIRYVRGLGQMQPVLFSTDRGVVRLSIEGASAGRACWWKFPLSYEKAKAKAAFAELEQCKRDGTRSPASLAWESRARNTQ